MSETVTKMNIQVGDTRERLNNDRNCKYKQSKHYNN